MNLQELNNRKENNKKTKKEDSKFNLKITRPTDEFIANLKEESYPKALGAGEVALMLTSQTEEVSDEITDEKKERKVYYIFGFSTKEPSTNFIVSVYGVNNAENKSLDIEGLQIPDARIPGAVRKLIYMRTLKSFLKENLQTEETENQKDTDITENTEETENWRDEYTEYEIEALNAWAEQEGKEIQEAMEKEDDDE